MFNSECLVADSRSTCSTKIHAEHVVVHCMVRQRAVAHLQRANAPGITLEVHCPPFPGIIQVKSLDML